MGSGRDRITTDSVELWLLGIGLVVGLVCVASLIFA